MAERLSLIAGSGALVPEVIAAAQGRGYALQVLSLERRRRVAGAPATPFDPSQPAEVLTYLRSFAPTMIAMAGGVRLSDRARERILALVGADPAPVGDTELSRFAAFLTAATGARVVGVHEIVAGLLAPEGLLAGPEPGATLLETAGFALSLARRTGRLDLGQGIVVSGRRAIAAEDVAGTDALLRRLRAYRRFGLAGDGASPLVLAKAAKPDQPHAIDLPAIGPRTIPNARKAGIALIAVEAGATVLIERAKLVAAANAARLPVIALRVPDG